MQIVIDLPIGEINRMIETGTYNPETLKDAVIYGKNLKTICHKIELEADYQDENVNADIAKGMYKALNMLNEHLSGKDKTDADSD